MVATRPARKQSDYDQYIKEQREIQNALLVVEETVLHQGRIWFKTELGYITIMPREENHHAWVMNAKEFPFHYLRVDRIK